MSRAPELGRVLPSHLGWRRAGEVTAGAVRAFAWGFELDLGDDAGAGLDDRPFEVFVRVGRSGAPEELRVDLGRTWSLDTDGDVEDGAEDLQPAEVCPLAEQLDAEELDRETYSVESVRRALQAIDQSPFA